MKILMTAAIVALALSQPARAAALKSTVIGCGAEADATKVLDLMVKKDKAGLARFAQPKIAAGACTDLARGLVVTADVKRPPLTCVRRSGDLECFWVATEVVDLNPVASPSPFAGGGRRGGRHP